MHTIDAMTYENIKSGDEQAYRPVDERFRHRIFAFCYRMTLDAEVASDLTQNVFLKLVSGIGSLGHAEALTCRIFTVARNEVYAFTRSRRDVRPVRDDDVWELTTPMEALLASERTVIISQLMASLRAEYREVILLREYDGLSNAEIALVANSTEPALKARLFKARKALLEKLKPYFGREGPWDAQRGKNRSARSPMASWVIPKREPCSAISAGALSARASMVASRACEKSCG